MLEKKLNQCLTFKNETFSKGWLYYKLKPFLYKAKQNLDLFLINWISYFSKLSSSNLSGVFQVLETLKIKQKRGKMKEKH
jgi:hypothetical protein